jgi:hydrogenase maturation protease
MTDPSTSPAGRPSALPLVIGLGNEHRSDDRSGLDVARALRPLLMGKARVEECVSEGIALLEVWKDSDHVLVVDAVRSGAAPGTVHRFDAEDGSLAGFRAGTSSHGLSLAEAVALAKGLGCLPRRLVVYGIEAERLEVGVGLSPPVARGVVEATARILAELEAESAAGAGRREPLHA